VQQNFDLAIIGGGLTGCAIARDAAGRGLSVFLCEQQDLAAGASSSTSKLVHGGLRHLASGHVSLLRRRLLERETLLRAAPHVVKPMRFLVPHHARMWPARAVGAGMILYDRLRRRSLPASRRIDVGDGTAGVSLQGHFKTAFTVHDCVADDARLTLLNALDASAHGANVVPRLRCVVAEREGAQWRLSLESSFADQRFSICAKVLVNATGPQVTETASHVIHSSQEISPQFRKSVSVYARRSLADPDAYALPNIDGSFVYITPVRDGLIRISADDRAHDGSFSSARATSRDIAFLLDVVGQYFANPPFPEDIVRTEASLAAFPHAVNPQRQDHAILSDAPPRLAPLMSIFGGSLTTHRWLAERVVDQIGRAIPVGRSWTATKPLPGGGFTTSDRDGLCRALVTAHPFVGSLHAARLVDSYGTRAADVVSGVRDRADLGEWFGGYLTEREVTYLRKEEWARSAEDILWRRTRLGMELDQSEQQRLAAWFAARPLDAPTELRQSGS
jgi:glycerol-3-phosphate dehydrogenase